MRHSVVLSTLFLAASAALLPACGDDAVDSDDAGYGIEETAILAEVIDLGGGSTGEPDGELDVGPSTPVPESRIVDIRETSSGQRVRAIPGDLVRERFPSADELVLTLEADTLRFRIINPQDAVLFSAAVALQPTPAYADGFRLDFGGSYLEIGVGSEHAAAKGVVDGFDVKLDIEFEDGEAIGMSKFDPESLPDAALDRTADVQAVVEDSLPVFDELASLPAGDTPQCKAAKIAVATAGLIAALSCCAATEGVGCPLCLIAATYLPVFIEPC